MTNFIEMWKELNVEMPKASHLHKFTIIHQVSVPLVTWEYVGVLSYSWTQEKASGVNLGLFWMLLLKVYLVFDFNHCDMLIWLTKYILRCDHHFNKPVQALIKCPYTLV